MLRGLWGLWLLLALYFIVVGLYARDSMRAEAICLARTCERGHPRMDRYAGCVCSEEPRP